MMLNKNHILLGIILGICAPVVGYALFIMLFEFLTSIGLLDEVSGTGMDQRTRTMMLLGICANIVPFEIYRKKRFEDTMRGLVFPTIIYVGIWVFLYKDVLFAG